MRYFSNNYADGVRQDGLDLVMGNYTVKQGAPSPFTRTGIKRYTNLRVALVVLVASTYLFLRNVIPSSSSSSPLSPVVAATSAVVAGSVLFALLPIPSNKPLPLLPAPQSPISFPPLPSPAASSSSPLSPVIAATSAVVAGSVLFALKKFGHLFCDRPRFCSLR
ncbi:unnamed protein product [Closterium sp. Naga37s-1]|nr:unnamed protein product [Closterium sp. Naga37s-1]